MKTHPINIIKALSLFTFILAIVLLVNLPILFANIMFPEQSLIYFANAKLNHFSDLIDIYLHPKMFSPAILFFRPTGYFLIYQILAPLLGWHNVDGFVLVNFIFLALAGYYLVRLYHALFSNYQAGAYIALALYLMHPALMLSRVIILHFEFAYVFFVLLSLYYFICYCQNRSKSSYLFITLVSYIIAVTFKEPALMLGPVLVSYWCLSLYQGQPIRHYIQSLTSRSNRAQPLIILCLFITLTFYISMQWLDSQYILKNSPNPTRLLGVLSKSFMFAFGIKGDPFPAIHWSNVIFTLGSRLILWVGTLCAIIASIYAFRFENLAVKKSMAFLYLAISIFMVLPIGYGDGQAWHLNLSLVFFCLLIGFSIQILLPKLVTLPWRHSNTALVSMIAFIITCSAYTTMKVNVDDIKQSKKFIMNLNRNALLHPPVSRDKLNANSFIVIEDTTIDPYDLGASTFPYVSVAYNSRDLNANDSEIFSNNMFLKHEPFYSASIFKWTYLIPSLKEQIYYFKPEDLASVSNLMIYAWLRHYNHIFCFAYDAKGHWMDKTELFKKNLLAEKEKRRFVINNYHIKSKTLMGGTSNYALNLPYADPQICQLSCDERQSCKGFTFIEGARAQNQIIKGCVLYQKLSSKEDQPCAYCHGYIKVVSS